MQPASVMQVISVNVGQPREVVWKGRTVVTGIFKEAVPGRVAVRLQRGAEDAVGATERGTRNLAVDSHVGKRRQHGARRRRSVRAVVRKRHGIGDCVANIRSRIAYRLREAEIGLLWCLGDTSCVVSCCGVVLIGCVYCCRIRLCIRASHLCLDLQRCRGCIGD